MHLTLHLTNRCNLNCTYCFVELGPERMTKEVAYAAVKLATTYPGPSGLLFYGGEPLLERELIYDIVKHTQSIKEQTSHIFYYKATTNGILLDEEFLKFAQKVNLSIGFSHDGPSQDTCRIFPGGGGSSSLLEDKILLLIKYQPYAIGMSVMDPSTVHNAAATVQFLFDKGFRYITINMNYSEDAPWIQENLLILETQYKKMAEMYIKWTNAEIKFYLSPIDMKIQSHLKGEKYNSDRRIMSQNQLSIGPDGTIYPNSRHIGDPTFAIGDVFNGINWDKQRDISEMGAIPPTPCQDCAIRTRCNYAYDSLVNSNGEISTYISPIRCVHEQIITPIADYVADTLYSNRNALFIHKHYNDMYPIVSLVEDKSVCY